MSIEFAQETVNTIAAELERLATRLRQTSTRLTEGKRDPVIIASEIVAEYVQATGTIGGRLGDVVRHASNNLGSNSNA